MNDKRFLDFLLTWAKVNNQGNCPVQEVLDDALVCICDNINSGIYSINAIIDSYMDKHKWDTL